MSEVHQLLECMLRTVHTAQSDIQIVTDAAYAASLKDTLARQLQEFDSIESELLTAAATRGWDISERITVSDSIRQVRLRLGLLLGCSDSRIGQIMIRRHTDTLNRNLKLLHRLEPRDRHIRTLFQKLADCQDSCIRQMQLYL